MTAAPTTVVGRPLDRVDGPRKVAGEAAYPTDVALPGLAHAAAVQSTIAAGRIRAITTEAAAAAPGVLAVVTHRNAPRLARTPDSRLGATPPAPLQDDRVLHHGQHVAVVVAETLEQATAAARLVEVDYEPAQALLDLDDERAEQLVDPMGADVQRGDVAAGLAGAAVTVDATYLTPEETNNPLGPFATVAVWDGDALTVHDSTQWPVSVRAALAAAFQLPEDRVRVLAPFVGGGFGAGLYCWPHTLLAALAASTVGRPVKLVMTRPQMFTSVGHRPPSRQRIRLGATRDGRLTAIDHEGTIATAIEDRNFIIVTRVTPAGYECPNVATRDRRVRLHVPWPGYMRAPGTAEGSFALESALDELAYEVGLDPIELRRRNFADVHPQLGLPWSSNALRACYEQGADRFGWSRRNPEPRSMRQGRWLVGYGMAGVTFGFYQAPCSARAALDREGRAVVQSSATDIGTGTYTVIAQLAADRLGLDPGQVRFELGDTDLPPAPQAGGSGLTGALGAAVHAACGQLVQAFLDAVADDPDSPLEGCGRLEDVTLGDGLIRRADDRGRSESYVDVLRRRGLDRLTADGESEPPRAQDLGVQPAGAFGAKFVEVHVDPDLGLIRVARVVSAVDGGRI
ncbi:MAG TPA: xanthine dehydrogenase family protein molybdopterin-binding subunit, partial [Candidatus Binatia bacterium]|nr:xanthine dehydrogenase family protein molybdopterin-binding subunit [Candidatus Binatia bacterium]